MNNCSVQARFRLCPGGAREPWEDYEQGRSRVSSGAM